MNDSGSNSDRVVAGSSLNISTCQAVFMSKAKLQTFMAMLVVAPWWSFLLANSRAYILERIDQNDAGMIDTGEFKAPNGRNPHSANKLLGKSVSLARHTPLQRGDCPDQQP